MNKCHTLRFEISLDSKNSENYEISLLDLIKKNKPQQKNDGNKEEFTEMEYYVKDLEEKYGPVAVVRGKRIRVNDFVDQGNGYDAEDPFIDDSEGEEALVVAPDLMTEHGGFFINNECLKLNDGNFVIERVEGGNTKMVNNNFPIQKFKKTIGKKTKSQKLLSQARKRLTISSKNNSIRHIATNSDQKLEKVINDVMAINKSIEVEKVENNIKITKKVEVIEVPASHISQEKESNIAQINEGVVAPTKVLELPNGLPNDVSEKIKSLITISKQCKPEDLRVSPQFNTVLIELDTLLITNPKGMKGIRTMVLRYISQIVDIKYDAILRKICKIKDNRKKMKLKPLIKALEESIKEAMVDSFAKYGHDMEQYNIKIEAQKLSSQILPISDSQNTSVEISTDTETDSKSKSSNKIKLPKRNFKWTLTCKSLLFKLVCGELDAFRISNSKGSPEEHLNKFYQSNVIPLFPLKWMTVSQLMKLSLPLIFEFKQCILNGKEFKTYSPGIKQKPVLKTKNQADTVTNDKIVSQTKETVIIITNCNTNMDLNSCQNNNIHAPVKKSIPATIPSKSLGINNGMVKPQLVVNSIDHPPRIPLKQPISKSSVRSSGIIPPSRVNKNQTTMTVKPIEPTKRYSDGSSILPSNTATQQIDINGFNLIGMPPQNNDTSLSHLQHYLYPHNNSTDQIRRSISVNPLVNNFVPHCSQETLSPNKRININEIVHSTPYSRVHDKILKMSCHTQNVPDISNIFTSPINVKQSIPQVINRPRTTSQNLVLEIEPLHKPYMSTIPDLSPRSSYHTQSLISPSKTIYHTQGFLTSPKSNYYPQRFGSPQMIDLTTDSSSSSERGQIQSPHYVNMNKAHCPNNSNVNN